MMSNMCDVIAIGCLSECPALFCPRDFYFGYMEEDEYVRGLVMG